MCVLRCDHAAARVECESRVGKPMYHRNLTATVVGEQGRFTDDGWEQEDDLILVTLHHLANVAPA